MIAPNNESNPASEPSNNGNARDSTGKFLKGWKGGSGGNPHAKRMIALRSVFLKEATVDRMQQAARLLWSLALDGDLEALKEVLNRTIGKPVNQIQFGITDCHGFDSRMTREELEQSLESCAAKLLGPDPKSN